MKTLRFDLVLGQSDFCQTGQRGIDAVVASSQHETDVQVGPRLQHLCQEMIEFSILLG